MVVIFVVLNAYLSVVYWPYKSLEHIYGSFKSLSASCPMVANWLNPNAWALEPEQSTFAPTSRWSNKDMDPVPVHLRTWATWNYVAYWVRDIIVIICSCFSYTL